MGIMLPREVTMQKDASVGEALKKRYPESVAIAIAKDGSGKHNPITLGWWMLTSGKPPMVAISVAPPRYSCDVIRSAGEFVLALPSSLQAEEALFYGTNSGRDIDKIKEFGGAISPASEIDSVLLDGAVANLECVVDGELASGDHVIYAGRVVAAHVNEDESLGLLYTLAAGYKMGGVRSE